MMMKSRLTAFTFVILLLFSSMLTVMVPHHQNPIYIGESAPERLEEVFLGFTAESESSVWNETNWPQIAVPGGFDFLSVYDYSDVGVLINNNSEASRTIGSAFIAARNISMERVFVFNNSSAPTKETINRNQFTDFFAEPFLEMVQNRPNASSINYLVTTKGMPLRVSGGNNKASFDQELSLLGGQYNSSVGGDYWVDHAYGPLAGKQMEAFDRETQGFYLVTRLTGYTVETALGLIEKANNSLGTRGVFALDLATNRNGSGYKFWNDDLYTANTTLNSTMGLPTSFDETSVFLTNLSNVMGYASWGSNDGSWSSNSLPNGGFDTASTSTSSGSEHWDATLPTLSAGDSFNWSLQTDTKQGGSSALEAAVAAECMPESAHGKPGIFSEFFDNTGVSFNAASMPSLIDRTPDHTRIESQLAYTSMYNAYPGLDNRFKNDWGARFSGLIDVPDAGNWTFYLTSDDGSELWLNDSSLVTNYGSHGMRERSNSIILDAGLHDFRIEFFQGGGPHGLTLHWEGPNQSKVLIPASAFKIAGDRIPSSETLQHHWSFEDGSGTLANDSGQAHTDFTLHNMNASNWNTCVDGGCLWYDGVDDYLEVDVQDWNGNFTVSQWVWANSTTLPNYASVFAAGTQAGSNASFQHAVFNGEWRLHNNQTHTFGAMKAQNWTHLVTVFEAGVAEQYLDGVLVRTTSFPTGSVDTIESYRLGVNRAGSTYFEGMIDEVMIWDSALSDGEVTSLHRDIYLDCAAYSGNGQAVASVQQTFTIDEEFEDHVWLASGFGMRTGDVFGTYEIKMEALDVNGTVISTNISSEQEFTTAWSSTTMRFNPPVNAVELRITIPLNLVATSSDGSVYLDTFKVYPIRPNNDWLNGSIAETAVSTGGRSFMIGTTYGQSLVADLLEDGASGVKGYVYEPYLTAVGLPSVLMGAYASGYNLAESHAAANLQTSWMGVTVGDPKMAPYADLFHDINIIDARVPDNASFGVPTTVQLALENKGMATANGSVLIQDIQGNIELYAGNLSLPSGDTIGSRTLVNVTITPQKTGWMDLRIRYDSSENASERITDNNLITLRLWVNAPPSVDEIYCDASTYARGDSFICTVEASDDINVTSVHLLWTVAANTSNLTGLIWTQQSLGTLDSVRWQTSITLPTNLSLGMLVIEAIAVDESQQATSRIVEDVAEVVDAQAQWFGPYVEGVDSASWSGATPLPYAPTGGIERGQLTSLRACVLDADHNPELDNASILASRGLVSHITHAPQLDSNHHCYLGTVLLSKGDSLDAVSFEVRAQNGALLSSRLIGVVDVAPVAELTLVDNNNLTLDRVLGGGGEYLQVQFSDADDPGTSVTGDLSIEWPGATAFVLPVDVLDINEPFIVELPAPDQPLESGELRVQIDATGRHGATLRLEEQFTFLLSPPMVIESAACDENGIAQSLRFGESLVLYALVDSERPLEFIRVSMSQLGWSVMAPMLVEASAGDVPAQCLQHSVDGDGDVTFVAFRLRLDGSFIDGEGQVSLIVRDIDGLSSTQTMTIDFFHAAPMLTMVPIANSTAGDRIEPVAYVSDLDGLSDVDCRIETLDNTTSLANVSLEPQVNAPASINGSLAFVFPTTSALANATLSFTFTCIDSWGQSASVSSTVFLQAPPPCIDCKDPSSEGNDAKSFEFSAMLAVGIALPFLLLTVSVIVLRRRKEDDAPPLWVVEDATPESVLDAQEPFNLAEGSAIPEGWSSEAYHQWLERGPPEGWSEEQWSSFVEEQLSFFSPIPSDVAEKV